MSGTDGITAIFDNGSFSVKCGRAQGLLFSCFHCWQAIYSGDRRLGFFHCFSHCVAFLEEFPAVSINSQTPSSFLAVGGVDGGSCEDTKNEKEEGGPMVAIAGGHVLDWDAMEKVHCLPSRLSVRLYTGCTPVTSALSFFVRISICFGPLTASFSCWLSSYAGVGAMLF